MKCSGCAWFMILVTLSYFFLGWEGLAQDCNKRLQRRKQVQSGCGGRLHVWRRDRTHNLSIEVFGPPGRNDSVQPSCLTSGQICTIKLIRHGQTAQTRKINCFWSTASMILFASDEQQSLKWSHLALITSCSGAGLQRWDASGLQSFNKPVLWSQVSSLLPFCWRSRHYSNTGVD